MYKVKSYTNAVARSVCKKIHAFYIRGFKREMEDVGKLFYNKIYTPCCSFPAGLIRPDQVWHVFTTI